MKVSVILPVYNGEKTLGATLDSLLDQTFQDFELIACIDGTRDGSEGILEKYSNKFKQLKILINHENRGLGPTMNRLVYESSGEYLAVAEQDDYYYPDRLALQVEKLNEDLSIGLVSGIAEFYNEKNVTFRFPGILINGNNYPKKEEMFLLNYKYFTKVVNSCMMFRKSVHVNNGLYFSQHYPNIPVDLCYFLRFCLVSDIAGIPKTLVRLDRSDDRNSVTTKRLIHHQALIELIRSFRYEYPEIVTKKVYKFSRRTLLLNKISQIYGVKFYINCMLYGILYFNDVRFRRKLFSRIHKFSKK